MAWLGLILGLVSCKSAAPLELPPAYSRPAAITRGFLARRASVKFVDARPLTKRFETASQDSLSDTELGLALERLLAKALGQGSDELSFTVRLIEASASSMYPLTVEATIEIAVVARGQTLVTTRGTCTLVGHIGGMSARTGERLGAAVVDAFERSVLRPAFIEATNAALAKPAEPDRPQPVSEVAGTSRRWAIGPHEASAAAHVLAAALDLGHTYSFGARYLHDHIGSASGLWWGGYGLEARMISADFEQLDAGAGLAVLRSGVGFEQAYSLELALGAGGRDEVRPLGVVGAFWTFYYLDLGFSYQFFVDPTSTLEPLSGAHFGLRINVPVDVHDVSVHCRSPLPCSTTLLPGMRRSGE